PEGAVCGEMGGLRLGGGQSVQRSRGNSYEPRASSIGSAKLIHIHANRTISARSSGSFMHSASDKHSHAFARYALLAAIGTFSSQPSRDPLNGSARFYARRLAARLRSHSMMSSPHRDWFLRGEPSSGGFASCVDNATMGNLFRDYFFPGQ